MPRCPGCWRSRIWSRRWTRSYSQPRTRFVLEHWNNVSTGVREEALEAVRAGWLNWIEQHEIQALSKRIANPAGRLAITLEIAKLSSLSGLAGR